MFEMICLFGYTLNIANSFETTWTQLIAFFVGTSVSYSTQCITYHADFLKRFLMHYHDLVLLRECLSLHVFKN